MIDWTKNPAIVQPISDELMKEVERIAKVLPRLSEQEIIEAGVHFICDCQLGEDGL